MIKIMLKMLLLNLIVRYSTIFFIISDFFVWKVWQTYQNAWNAMNCYFLVTFPVLFTTFLMYSWTRHRRYAYLSLFFVNLLNMFWAMFGILLSSSFRMEQYLWFRLFVYGFSTFFCYKRVNKCK